MARLGRTQLKARIVPTRAPNSIADIITATASFEITTNGNVSFPVVAYLDGLPAFTVTTQGQIVKRQDIEGSVDFRIGTTVGQAEPVGLLLAITNPTRGLTYQLDRSLTVTAATTTTNTNKNVSKSLLGSSLIVATVTKRFNQLLSAASFVSTQLTRLLPRSLTASSTVTATNTRLSVVERFITTSVSTTASLTRSVYKTISTPVASATTFLRSVAKNVVASSPISVSISKTVSKTISRAITTSLNLIQSGSQAIDLFVTVTVLPTMSRLVTKSISRTISTARSLNAFAPNAPTGTGSVAKLVIPTSEIIILENTPDELSLLINTEDKVYTPR